MAARRGGGTCEAKTPGAERSSVSRRLRARRTAGPRATRHSVIEHGARPLHSVARMKRVAAPLLVFAFLLAASLRAAEAALPDGLYAEFSTPRGTFVAELFYEQTPLTCASFVGRAEGTLTPRDGKPFFTGLRWYRVVPGFVIQSGDPTAPRAGEPPRSEADEAAAHPRVFADEFGSLSTDSDWVPKEMLKLIMHARYPEMSNVTRQYTVQTGWDLPTQGGYDVVIDLRHLRDFEL